MKNFNFYTSRADHVYLNGFWRYITVLLAAVLSLGTDVQAQGGKTPPNPGVPSTQNYNVNLEVDADFKTGEVPTWWNTIYGYDNSTQAKSLVIGKDWSTLIPGPARGSYNNGTTVWATDGNSGNKASVDFIERNIFGGTSNKNGDPIGINQSPYTIVDKAAGPQKNDITNVYFHKEVISGRTWLFFGAETRSTDGTSYLDFEYNQAGVVIADGKMYGPKQTGASVVNGRTVQDFIIVVNFSGGGKQPSVGIRSWESTGVWSNEMAGGLGSGKAFIVTNVQDVNAIASSGSFNGDGSMSSTSSAFQFVEGAVDITEILPTATCSPFATMTAKTRSSDSFTAELKDLFIVDYPLNPSPQVSVTGGEACVGATLSFSASVTSGTGPFNYQWYRGSVADANKVGTNSSTYSKTAATADNGVSFIVVVTDANNCQGQGSKTAVVNPLPQVSVTGGEACVGATLSFSASVTSGTGTGPFNYQWYRGSVADANKVGTNSSTYSKTAEAADDGISFIVVVTDSKTCQGQGSKAAKITDNPLPPVVKYNPPACDEDKFTLRVTGVSVGDKVTLVDKSGAVISSASPVSPYTVKSTDKVILEDNSEVVGFMFIDIPAGSGYKVSVETAAGCKSDPEVCPAPNGLKADSGEAVKAINRLVGDEFTTYPVPFSDKATIEFISENGGNYEINLYDMKGAFIKQLKSGNAKAGEVTHIEVDGRSMAEGMYFARMVSNTSKKTVKLLLKR